MTNPIDQVELENRITTLEIHSEQLMTQYGEINKKLDSIFKKLDNGTSVKWIVGLTIMNAALMVGAIGVVVALQTWG